MEYLSQRPTLDERHRRYFEALSTKETLLVLSRLQSERVVSPNRLMDEVTGVGLFRLCQEEGLDHVGVVLPVSRERTGVGLSALEKLIGHPITPWRDSVARTQTVTAPVAAVGSVAPPPRRTSPAPSDDLVVLSVVAENPKKKKTATWHRFQHWVPGRTVAECLRAGLARADVPWDTDPSRGFVVLGTRAEWDAQRKSGEG